MLYLNEQETSTAGVNAGMAEVRGLLQRRNELAVLMKQHGSLPEPCGRVFTCRHCPQISTCMIHHLAAEGGSTASSGLEELNAFELHTAHLTREHTEYLMHWIETIDIEMDRGVTCMHELWTMGSEARASGGKCCSRLEIVGVTEQPGPSRRFLYTFQALDPSAQLDRTELTSGTVAVVSTQAGEFALATGRVQTLSSSQIVLRVEAPVRSCRRHISTSQPVYRIDKLEFSSSLAQCKGNILKLFHDQPEGRNVRLRELVVERQRPRFQAPPQELLDNIRRNSGLNSDQRHAVEKVLSAKDYALILGMPGTGKTTTTACIISVLLRAGKSVLLVSYMHSAVDNVLLKLLPKHRHDVLRLGEPAKVSWHANLCRDAWSVGASRGAPVGARGCQCPAAGRKDANQPAGRMHVPCCRACNLHPQKV